MNKVRRFVVGAVLMVATVFVFSSCNKDDDMTEKDSGSKNSQGNQNGCENGRNGGNGVSGNHEYVDFGLPSGTKWATCNVGATKPEEYGGYFAWGETETKETYTENNSKWYGCSYAELQAQGVLDANGSLTAKFDVATVNWGNDWKMPTIDELHELLSLDNEYAEVNGVKGRKFMGNGNTLFLPFAGYRNCDKLYHADESCYWSVKVCEDDLSAYSLYVYSEEAFGVNFLRYYGCSVRPVLRTE